MHAIATPPVNLNTETWGNQARIEVDRRQVSDQAGVPVDFTELYQRYYGYVVRLISQRGIVYDDVEDVAHTILIHFFRHDALADYDPERTFHGRRARFTTFLSGFVLTYLQHHLDRQRIVTDRSTRLDLLTEDADEEDSWANRKGPSYNDDTTAPEYDELVGSIHARLEASTFNGSVNLVRLFEAMRVQIAETGAYNTAELSAQLGTNPSTLQNAIKRLRSELEGL